MGGTFGEVRGKSKIETYAKYVEIADSDMWGDRVPDPRNKKGCKKLMVQDPETGEWVLHFHLHT